MATTHQLTPVSLAATFPDGHKALAALEASLRAMPLPAPTRELIKLRASQINGCAFCLDMHWKDARAAGETEERLAMLPAWRESTVYTAPERAALAIAEAVTLIADGHLPAAVETEARAELGDAGFAAAVYTTIAINAWNRLAIASHNEPGHYQPGDHQ